MANSRLFAEFLRELLWDRSRLLRMLIFVEICSITAETDILCIFSIKLCIDKHDLVCYSI